MLLAAALSANNAVFGIPFACVGWACCSGDVDTSISLPSFRIISTL